MSLPYRDFYYPLNVFMHILTHEEGGVDYLHYALFENEDVGPRVIIRWKDIFEALEQAIDACDRTAHVIGNIVVKNA